MDFMKLATERHSVRDYRSTKVEMHLLESLIEAASLAPSACNSQPWRFIVVNDDSVKQLAKLLQNPDGTVNKFTDDVPAIIVVCETPASIIQADGSYGYNQKYAQMDIGMAVMNICLQARSIGLSTCIMGHLDADKIKSLFDIPPKVNVRLCIAVGYKKGDDIPEKKRKPIREIMNFNKY